MPAPPNHCIGHHLRKQTVDRGLDKCCTGQPHLKKNFLGDFPSHLIEAINKEIWKIRGDLG